VIIEIGPISEIPARRTKEEQESYLLFLIGGREGRSRFRFLVIGSACRAE
jgi:hypothetical protein